jgi:MoxR-like ATPase
LRQRPARPRHRPPFRDDNRMTGDSDIQAVERLGKARDAIVAELRKTIVGMDEVIDELMIAIFARGHCLLVGVPGLAKTLLVSTLAQTMSLSFKRIQFTPDLMPSDITGTELLQEDPETHQRRFQFQKGPVFTNLLLADEINRTPPKTQAALLEAMQEKRVSSGGEDHKLDEPFFVLATQNPIEQEGTYPLPEAQMDRFLLHVNVPYPAAENEAAILRLVRGEKTGTAAEPPAAIDQDLIFTARKEVNTVHVAETAENYMVDLVIATREPKRYGGDLEKWIRLGASPRGTLALDAAARAHAWLQGQDFVSPENIRAVAPACLAHRIHPTYEAEAAGIGRSDIIDAVLEQIVAV